jgi:predicted N-acetyltransferase YhbS
LDILNVDGYWLAALLIGAGAVLALSAYGLHPRSRVGTFKLPNSRPVPPCVIRLLVPDDFPACEALYRLNEARFPPGMFGAFSEYLRAGKALFLVAESNREVVAMGGVSMQRTGKREMASLVFGLVHPSFQRRGYGTALLRARLAMLPLARGAWIVLITVAGGSETFYARFGFRHLPVAKRDDALPLDNYVVLVPPRAQKRCARWVASVLAPAPLGQTPVPPIEYAASAPSG